MCESCKHASELPPELRDVYASILQYYPRKFYCLKLQAVKVYNPDKPSQVFECEHFEVREQ